MLTQIRARLPGVPAAAGLALTALMLTSGAVAAQSPSATTAPAATTAPTGSTDDFPPGGHRGFARGFGGAFDQRGPEGRGLDGFGLDGFGPGGDRIGRSVIVATNDGTSLGLETADGWTRTIDTTGVVVTRDRVTIAAADILVGERVRVVQTRNADGSYTVTGIEVQPATATGTVGTVSTDGFTVVEADGTTTVTVNEQTTWWARRAASVTIADATAGRAVIVVGDPQAEGSIGAPGVHVG
jgi:hypothetical protein